jgi:hypothetical protein
MKNTDSILAEPNDDSFQVRYLTKEEFLEREAERKRLPGCVIEILPTAKPPEAVRRFMLQVVTRQLRSLLEHHQVRELIPAAEGN